MSDDQLLFPVLTAGFVRMELVPGVQLTLASIKHYLEISKFVFGDRGRMRVSWFTVKKLNVCTHLRHKMWKPMSYSKLNYSNLLSMIFFQYWFSQSIEVMYLFTSLIWPCLILSFSREPVIILIMQPSIVIQKGAYGKLSPAVTTWGHGNNAVIPPAEQCNKLSPTHRIVVCVC